MEEEHLEVKKNNKWKIMIVPLIVIVVIAMIFVVKRFINVSQTSGSKLEESIEKNNVEEIESLENLTSITNKTEEELKKINEEEIKKQEEKKTDKEYNTQKAKNKYYIKVNYEAQVVNIYTYDKNGKYTVPVKAFVCSTGTETPTSGVYRIPAKITWCHMLGDVYAHYCSQIVGNILFHSVPYLEKSNDTLEYWAYDKLGTKASMGCIRLTTRDAKWIFDNVPCGTEVEFYASSNPGPLGKPSAQKISNAPENLKNWDPTDPDPKNPWHTYKPENEKKEENVTQNNISNNEAINSEVVNNEAVNSEEVNNEVLNSEIVNDQTTNNQTQNNELVNNQVINNEIANNEIIDNQQKSENNSKSDNKSENNDVSSNQV